MYDVQELEKVVDAEAREVVGQDEDLCLSLHILPDPHLSRLQLFPHVLELQIVGHRGWFVGLAIGIVEGSSSIPVLQATAVVVRVPKDDLTIGVHDVPQGSEIGMGTS